MPEDNYLPIPQRLNFEDLVDVKDWQNLQDRFADLIDITIKTVSPSGRAITKPSKEPRYCTQIVKDSPHYERLCNRWALDSAQDKAAFEKNMFFSTETGLFHSVLKLNLAGDILLAYVILGPVILVMRKEKEQYRPIAERLGVDFDTFWDALLEIKVVSYQRLKAVSELIKDTGAFMIRLAYRAYEKEMMLSERSRLKPQKFFEDFLSVAREMTEADICSVMMFDGQRQKLTIKASYGIPEEIVQNTEVHPGESIAGVVAENAQPMLIDEKNPDNRIRGALKRPYLGAAMVLPICAHNTVIGVLNLGVLKTKKASFTPEMLSRAEALVNLTSGQFANE